MYLLFVMASIDLMNSQFAETVDNLMISIDHRC